ncbi:YdcH family protein [Stenotrophomonas tumulicola]|uniref:YdcH family protein n=1 Tax=Stenotrophomonas tumulicola TaxID=1685415 RepID=A0A7W3FP73_9GAMM|nr:YdcH family protein [Stenotrophomonas tumulicola]MBA8683201.1 YdcH family protein [Stenotrophomonas tumulicola]
MFEDQPQSEIEARRARDPEFRTLHDAHRKLNRQCMDAELGVLAVSDVTLGQMKREKLLAKQRLQRMFETTPQTHTSPAH